MTTPNPKGYPTACAALERIANGKRDRFFDEHWSFREALRTRVKRESKAKLRLKALADAD